MNKKIFYAFMLYAVIITILCLPVWQQLDDQIARFFIEHRTPSLTYFFNVFTNIASTPATIAFTVVIGGVLLMKKKTQLGIQLILSIVTSASLVGTLKLIFERARPSIDALHLETSYSFPSGHTNAITTVIGFLLLATWNSRLPRLFKLSCFTIGTLCILLVACSRLYLSVHWFTDIIAGLSTGFFSLYIWEHVHYKSAS